MLAFDYSKYAWCVVGVVISVVLPVLWTYVRGRFPPKTPDVGPKNFPQVIKFLDVLKPYAAGYAWDSTLQKLR